MNRWSYSEPPNLISCRASPTNVLPNIIAGDYRRTNMQAHGKAVDAAAAHTSLSPQALIDLQRKTVAEHIKHEQVKDWPEVYRTFTPHGDDAYYDVGLSKRGFRR
jgi:hypothetical protein